MEILRKVATLLGSLQLFILPLAVKALPVDWHGTFGLDTTMISDYRSSSSSAQLGPGSQRVEQGESAKASFQTYMFKLNPSIIINDSASFYAELSSGYARGGYLGEGIQRSHRHPHRETPDIASGDNNLSLTKMYVKYYADTATYILGRHSYHWGLGAVYNGGEGLWNRHLSARDGATLEIKFGNFYLTPYWAKTDHTDLTATEKEYGLGLLYDNHERDLAFGLHYGKKSDIKITDIYLKKTVDRWSLGFEMPLLSGEVRGAYSPNSFSSYKAQAFLVEGRYRFSDLWDFSLKAGRMSGDDGDDQSAFQAIYLHPNFHIANLLFRYNFKAMADPGNYNLFDSYMTNASFLKMGATYIGRKWDVDFSLIMAMAQEVAKKGQQAFNHTTYETFSSQAEQESGLGTEFDVNLHYKWNKEISVGILLGYLLRGNYYAFTNEQTPLSEEEETKNSVFMQLNTAINF